MTIRLLDELTVNQIAAGEVVERPASVLKELLENSLDAGASEVDIRLENGGIDLIEVRDNGEGIPPGEVRLAFERHATSKITSFEDLQRLATFGFRGEALPSISSVSRVEMVTRTADAKAATRIVIKAGDVVAFGEEAGPAGTTVSVSEIFGNVPARKKHLRTAATEFKRCATVVSAAVLANPGVRFTLTHGGRRVLTATGSGKLSSAAAAVFGPETARNMVPLSAEGPVGVAGLVGTPETARSSPDHQFFLVNGRFVQSSFLREAVMDGFRGFLTVGRHPVLVLSLAVDPSEVDVNIHPAKLAVRFADAGAVRRAVVRAVRAALSGERMIPSGFSTTERGRRPAFLEKGREEAACRVQEAAESDLFGREEPPPSSQPEEGGSFSLERLYPIGQVLRSYIAAEGPKGLYLIDQHAAHERILYEKLSFSEAPPSQLGIPFSVELEPGDYEVLKENLGVFDEAGFEIVDFGTRSVAVRAWPADFSPDVRIFLEVLDNLRKENKGKSLTVRELRTAMASCHSSLRANRALSQAEMVSLLEQLARCRQPYTCPHGRPTVILVEREEIERRFRRR